MICGCFQSQMLCLFELEIWLLFGLASSGQKMADLRPIWYVTVSVNSDIQFQPDFV